jgi:hypothetical protein
MSNDKFDLTERTKALEQLKAQLKLPSEEEMKSELERLNKLYSTSVKTKLEQLKKAKFIGTANDELSTDGEEDGSCSIEMTSQYEVLDVIISPTFLLNALKESQVDTTKIELEQLVQICILLGEVAKSAFNKAREKTHAGSEKVFNQLMEEMQKSLFGKPTDDSV